MKSWMRTFRAIFSSDHEDPIINNTPANIIRNTDSGLPTAIVTWQEPTATDNSGSQTLTSSHHPGSSFNIGITIITYTSIDSSGNTVTDSFITDIHGKQLASTPLIQIESY